MTSEDFQKGDQSDTPNLGFKDMMNDLEQKRDLDLTKDAIKLFDKLGGKEQIKMAIDSGKEKVSIVLGSVPTDEIKEGSTKNKYTKLVQMINEDGYKATLLHCSFKAHYENKTHMSKCGFCNIKRGTQFTNFHLYSFVPKSRTALCRIEISFNHN